ncbi:hypothetical protein [Streptomyces sp. LUP30]|nr:hypothetical protein [Streptomyces sp. LUP30]
MRKGAASECAPGYADGARLRTISERTEARLLGQGYAAGHLRALLDPR